MKWVENSSDGPVNFDWFKPDKREKRERRERRERTEKRKD